MKNKINPINRSKFDSLFCKHKWVTQNNNTICIYCKIDKIIYESQQKLLQKIN